MWIVSEEGVLIFLYGFSLSGRVLFLWKGLISGVSINIAVFFSFVFSIAPPGSNQAHVLPPTLKHRTDWFEQECDLSLEVQLTVWSLVWLAP